MKDLNTSAFTGRLTRQPELKRTTGGTAYAWARVAVQRPHGPEGEDRGAAFFDVKVWSGTAEALCSYTDKGSRIAVEGRLELDEWEKDGQIRQRVYVLANPGGVQFLDPKEDSTEEKSEPEELPAAA
jgi:single-strand DNA-binding protein